MNRNIHETARELIALGDQQDWLKNHLRDCASCNDFAAAVSQTLSALHSQPNAADFALVQATQRRVRLRALELRQQTERIWLACLACLFVGLSTALTTPLFWRACEWIGRRAGLGTWVWQTGFGFFWIVPALVVSTLLLAHGTHLSNDEKHEL